MSPRCNESGEDDIKSVRAGKDPAESPEPSEQALDTVVPPIRFLIVRPGSGTIALWRNHGQEALSRIGYRVTSSSYA